MSKWEYTETELWRHGSEGIALFHVFGLVAVKNVVLAFSEAREGDGGDADCSHAIWMRRSCDGGRTFEPSICLCPGEGGHCWTNPVPVYDAVTGRVFLFYSDNQGNYRTKNYVSYSDDQGISWSPAQSVTHFLEPNDGLVSFHLAGPGHGIQLRDGVHAGRLIVPFWHRKYGVEKSPQERGYCISVLYSDDHGASWQHTELIGQECLANESRIVQTQESLLWVIRSGNTSLCRYESRSYDDGITWTKPMLQPLGPANNCDAGAAYVCGKKGFENMVLVSRVSKEKQRRDMEILISMDGGVTFPDKMPLPPGDVMPGYSDLCVIEEEEPVVGLVHCRNNHVLFSRISVQTLTGGAYENTKRNVWLN